MTSQQRLPVIYMCAKLTYFIKCFTKASNELQNNW